MRLTKPLKQTNLVWVWTLGSLIQPDIGSGRDDLIDPVQNVVTETNLGPGEQIVEMPCSCAAQEWPT